MQEEFCIVDLWAAEAYLTALDADAYNMLDMLQQGVKIHKWLQELVSAQFPKEVAKANYGYHEAKQNIHSLNYGVRPEKMSMESKLPLVVSEWTYNMYHTKFPGIQLRQRRIDRQIEKTATLTSFLGRRRTFVAPLSQQLKNQAYAWPSQSCIGELALVAMSKLYYWGQWKDPWILPCLNTHDGLVSRVHTGTREAIVQLMTNAFDIEIPKGNLKITIPISISFGPNFQDQEDETVIRYDMEIVQ